MSHVLKLWNETAGCQVVCDTSSTTITTVCLGDRGSQWMDLGKHGERGTPPKFNQWIPKMMGWKIGNCISFQILLFCIYVKFHGGSD